MTTILGSGLQPARQILRRLLKQNLQLQPKRRYVFIGLIQWQSYEYLITFCGYAGQIANKVRELSWGKPVETVSMPSLQHQVYLTTPEEG